MRRSTIACSAVAVLAGTLSGCGASAEDPNTAACDAFAYYLGQADSVAGMDRATTVDQVRYELHEDNADSDVEIDAMIDTGLGDLERAADASDQVWTTAADTMAAACMDYGWTAD